MKDKVIVLTGATSGIGEVAARRLAEMGAKVFIISRNPNKTRSIAQQIQEAGGKALAFTADLSSIQEVRRVATEIHQNTDHVDVLLNNAGAVFTTRQISVDGYEMSFALNHLNYFVLTHELMDLLRRGSNPRIVNVSSAAHLNGHIDFDDLQSRKNFSGWRAYSNSKEMNVLFTYELSRRLNGDGITANVLHPGFVATNFGKSNGGIYKGVFGLAHLGAISPEEGARTSIYLSSSSEVEGVTGKYFVNSKEARSSDESYDQTVATRLWEESERMTA